jgi:hypothetical protein
LAVFATGDTPRTDAPHSALQTGHLYHLAMVIDDDANGGTDEMSVYLDGALQTSVGHSRSLSNVLNTFAYLGESLISGDPNFNGSIDEFRIYNNAMDLGQVQASFAAGPTPQLSMHLEVNTVTGSVEIVGAEPMPVAFDYYSITSAGGALDPVGWSSLSDRDVDTTGPGVGHSWDEGDSSDSFELVELYLRGASNIDEGERIALGHAFDTSFFGQGLEGDLEFRFARQGSQTLSTAEVVYVTPAPMDGDYNGDLTVNAADYTVWRNAVAGAYNPIADGDGDGTNDHDDYVIWKWNYGNTSELGSGASQQNSIPEPTTALLMLLAMLVSAGMTCRRVR